MNASASYSKSALLCTESVDNSVGKLLIETLVLDRLGWNGICTFFRQPPNSQEKSSTCQRQGGEQPECETFSQRPDLAA
jgi:hypothetical protein